MSYTGTNLVSNMHNSTRPAHTFFHKPYTPSHSHTRTMRLSYSKGTETENHCLLLCLYCSQPARLPWGCSNWLVQSLLSTRYSFSTSSVRCLPEGPSCHTKDIGRNVKTHKWTKLCRCNEYCHTACTAQVLISQMSTSTAHNNEYLMHLSWFRTSLSPYRFKSPAWFIMCVEHLFSVPLQQASLEGAAIDLTLFENVFLFFFSLTSPLVAIEYTVIVGICWLGYRIIINVPHRQCSVTHSWGIFKALVDAYQTHRKHAIFRILSWYRWNWWL